MTLSRRVPLARGGPLARTTGLTRRTPLTWRPKRRSRTAVRLAEADRERLYLRARGRCEATGRPVTYGGFADHHRQLRSRGGSDCLSNRMFLHPDAHTAGPHAVHRIGQAAYDAGWLVRSTEDPAGTPVLVWGVGWRLLTADGGYEIRKAA